jgi:YggT family protein
MNAFCVDLPCVFVETFVSAFAWALTALVFVRVILSWVQLPLPAGLSRWIFDVTEPLLSPIRRALPATLGFDFSPVIALVLVQLVERVLLRFIPAVIP